MAGPVPRKDKKYNIVVIAADIYKYVDMTKN